MLRERKLFLTQEPFQVCENYNIIFSEDEGSEDEDDEEVL